MSLEDNLLFLHELLFGRVCIEYEIYPQIDIIDTKDVGIGFAPYYTEGIISSSTHSFPAHHRVRGAGT
jgi:hypothetical protein